MQSRLDRSLPAWSIQADAAGSGRRDEHVARPHGRGVRVGAQHDPADRDGRGVRARRGDERLQLREARAAREEELAPAARHLQEHAPLRRLGPRGGLRRRRRLRLRVLLLLLLQVPQQQVPRGPLRRRGFGSERALRPALCVLWQ